MSSAILVLINTMLLALYQFTVKRGQFCLHRIDEILVKHGFEGLRPDVDRALGVYKEAMEFEETWETTSFVAQHGQNAVEVDNELVRVFSAFDEGLALTVKAFGESSSRGETAKGLRAALFPGGVASVSKLSFVEKEAKVTFLLGKLESRPELAQAVQDLDLSELVDRLTEVATRYRAVIQVKKPTFEEVRAVRRGCQEELSRVTVLLLARRVAADLSSEEAEALDEALEEILGHQEAIRRHRRLRRNPEEVAAEPEDELGFDDESSEGAALKDESAEGPVADDSAVEGPALDDESEEGNATTDPTVEDKAEEEKETGPAVIPIAQPLNPRAADNGANTGAA